MSKTITIKKDEETGEFYFDINELSDIVDIESIESIDTYSIILKDDNTISVEFFDKDNNPIIFKIK